jgi:hypothetical protein
MKRPSRIKRMVVSLNGTPYCSLLHTSGLISLTNVAPDSRSGFLQFNFTIANYVLYLISNIVQYSFHLCLTFPFHDAFSLSEFNKYHSTLMAKAAYSR